MSDNDEEPVIPRSTINKVLKELMPTTRVACDTRDLITACCSEFIKFISTEANKICHNSDKKTITPEHIFSALKNFGFEEYVAHVQDVLKDCKERVATRKKCSHRLENLGIPEEELLRQQEELFAKARSEQAALQQQDWIQFQQATMVQSHVFSPLLPKASDQEGSENFQALQCEAISSQHSSHPCTLANNNYADPDDIYD